MSTKLIILLVGFLFILILVLSSFRTSSGARLISAKIGVPLGVIGVLLLMYASYSSELGNYTSQIEQVSTANKLKIEGPVNATKVISPVSKDTVDCRILTMGVYPQSNDMDIWVLIRPTDDRYYPQSDHTNTSYKRDGKWQVVTRFGGDFGEAYDLIVYEVDAEASRFFSSTIEKWKEAENYPGLKQEEIPTGAREVDRIVVYSGKNCRGVF